MMEDRMRRMEEFSLLSLDLHRGMEATQRQMAESQRQIEERQRQMEENQRHVQELLARMTQLVALVQADIVRLDETR